MLSLKYAGEKTSYIISFKKISKNIIQITGDFPVKRKGFVCCRVGSEDVLGDHTDYKTVYREIEGGAQFSNDGSVYTVPVPIVSFTAGLGGTVDGRKVQAVDLYEKLVLPSPLPEENYVFSGWNPEIPETGEINGNVTFQANFSYVETLEEVKEAKVAEMNAVQQQIITAGIDVTLTDGTTDHFDLTDRDQMRIMGLQSQVASGTELISWHTSNEDEHCKFYSNADMAMIAEKAMSYVTWHVTYFRDLRIYIRSLETKEAVADVEYGMDIPVEYQSNPLKDMIATRARAEQE